MKNTKMIALTLVVAIMLVGAGYAAWNDKIETESTIRSGELNITMRAVPDVSLNKNFKGEDIETLESLNDLFNVEVGEYTDDYVEFRINNIYPGAEARTHLSYHNDGTMTAFINDVDVEITGDQELADAILVGYNFNILKQRPDGGYDTRTKITTGAAGPRIPLSQLEQELEDKLVGIYLEAGEVLAGGPEHDYQHYTVIFKIPEDSLNGDEGENQEVVVKIRIDFVQHNMFEGPINDMNHNL